MARADDAVSYAPRAHASVVWSKPKVELASPQVRSTNSSASVDTDAEQARVEAPTLGKAARRRGAKVAAAICATLARGKVASELRQALIRDLSTGAGSCSSKRAGDGDSAALESSAVSLAAGQIMSKARADYLADRPTVRLLLQPATRALLAVFEGGLFAVRSRLEVLDAAGAAVTASDQGERAILDDLCDRYVNLEAHLMLANAFPAGSDDGDERGKVLSRFVLDAILHGPVAMEELAQKLDRECESLVLLPTPSVSPAICAGVILADKPLAASLLRSLVLGYETLDHRLGELCVASHRDGALPVTKLSFTALQDVYDCLRLARFTVSEKRSNRPL